MTKLEANKVCKLLESIGFRETEMVRWQTGGWRVYATDNATGYRIAADSLESAQGRVQGRKADLAYAAHLAATDQPYFDPEVDYR